MSDLISDKMPADPALIDRFIFAAERAGATTERIETSAEAMRAALIQAIAGAQGALLAEPDDLPAELFTPLAEIPGVARHPSEEQLAAAEVGITDAFAAIARTGSICVSITPGLAGAVSLFTRKHIAFVAAGDIVPRPRDIFTTSHLRDKALGRNFVFVTCPSCTADMGPLVRGVHGPGKLHVIILG